MRLYYVFGALVLHGLLQSALAKEGFGSSEGGKMKRNPGDCIFHQNTTTAALNNTGLDIDCLHIAHVTELNVTGDDGNVCATINDQGFQQCMWETACKVKVDLTTACSEEINITHVCTFRPRGSLSLYNVRNNRHGKKTNTSGNQKQKKKARGRKQKKGQQDSSTSSKKHKGGSQRKSWRHQEDPSQGLVLSHSTYLRGKFSSMNHPPSKATIKRPKNTDFDHLVFTIYTMDVGTEKLEVVAEDSDGTTRKFSYTGALTLSDELSKRTTVISDIKPHNVTVSLSGLPASDVKKGFGLCYKWINWNPANQTKETYDTCKHLQTRCITPKIYKVLKMRASRKHRGKKGGAMKGKNKKGKGAAKKGKEGQDGAMKRRKGKGGAKKGKKGKGGAMKGKKGKDGAKKGKKGKDGAKKGKKGKDGAKRGRKGKGGAKKGKKGKKGSKKDGGARKKQKRTRSQEKDKGKSSDDR